MATCQAILQAAAACPFGAQIPVPAHCARWSAVSSWLPSHSVGAYYFLLRTWRGFGSVKKILERAFRAIATRFHLRHPWWIPVKLLGELRAFVSALRLLRKGPRLITNVAGTVQTASAAAVIGQVQ